MNFPLNLTAEDIRILGIALQDQPYKLVAGLIYKIQQQVNQAEEAAKAKPTAEEASAAPPSA